MTTEAARPTDGHDALPLEDGQLAEVLDAYLADVEAGRAVDIEALVEAHPAIADRLRDCLGVLQAVGRVASHEPLREPEDSESLGTLGDYRIIRQVGRGGMGIVYEAEQVSLGRRVALKILPFAAAFDPPQLARFRLEAQAAAHLHHANIVPVHAIGSERGVHFYAMQFIEGQPLDALIADLRRSEAATTPSKTPRPAPTPPAAPSTFPSARGRAYLRLVAELGIQAAEALDHAHRLGIVHRDVKPANLILDDRGHLWITDFGLARVQSSPALTSTGHVLGTLRYMSPEQALARRDVVDHRADIYSLGATLYELLTLRPVFDGVDRTDLLRQIERDEPRPPRRLDSSIPLDLETIVLKALAKEPARRYVTAKELADDLRRHLDHRPILARRPTPWQRVTKWARRNQAATASAMAALLVSTVVLAIALTLLAAKQRELVREHDEAVRQGERGARNFRHATDAVEQMLSNVGLNTLRDVPKAEPVRRALLEKALAFYQRLAAEEDDPSLRLETARAFGRVAYIDNQLGRDAEASRAFDRSIELLESLAADRPTDRDARFALAQTCQNQGTLRFKLGDREGAEASFGRAVLLLEELAAAKKESRSYRESLAAVLKNRTFTLMNAGRLDDAEKAGARALDLTKGLIAETPNKADYPSQAGGILNNLALIAMEREEKAKARAFLTGAIEFQRKALALDGKSRGIRDFLRNHLENLAINEDHLGNGEAAIEAFREIIAIGEGLVADFPGVPAHRRELAGSFHNAANILGGLGRWDESERDHRRAIEAYEALAAEHPDAAEYVNELAGSHHDLGQLLTDRGRVAETAAEFRRAIEVFEKLSAAHPDRADYRKSVVETYALLAHTLSTCANPQDRDPEQALAYARKALDLAPANGPARAALGIAHYAGGRWDEAIRSLEAATKGSQDDARPLFYLAMAHHRLGNDAEGRKWFAKGVELTDRDAKPDGDPSIHRARAEAAALLGIDDRPASQAEGPPSQATGRPVEPK